MYSGQMSCPVGYIERCIGQWVVDLITENTVWFQEIPFTDTVSSIRAEIYSVSNVVAKGFSLEINAFMCALWSISIAGTLRSDTKLDINVCSST